MSDSIKIPLNRPALVNYSEVEQTLRAVWRSERITLGEQVAELEDWFVRETGAAHAVCVSSATAGLMIAIRALGMTGRVIVPSFTWASTGHAVLWNGLTPVFCDAEDGVWTLDPSQVDALVTEGVTGIVATNVFGVPPAIDALARIAADRGLSLLIDSAQGTGASYRGKKVGGFGDAEVFSLAPTKGLTAGEGGVVTTNDADLAARLRSLRDCGKSADGSDIVDVGLNARMSEFHAAVANRNAKEVERGREARGTIAAQYRELLADVPVIRFQEIPADRESCHTYCVIAVDERHPVTRDVLHELLATMGIETKRYFFPPLHLQTAYAGYRARYEGTLPVTEKASQGGAGAAVLQPDAAQGRRDRLPGDPRDDLTRDAASNAGR